MLKHHSCSCQLQQALPQCLHQDLAFIILHFAFSLMLLRVEMEVTGLELITVYAETLQVCTSWALILPCKQGEWAARL